MQLRFNQARFIQMAAVLAAIATSGLANAQEKLVDWPQFRGPGGSSTTRAALPITWSDTENIVWKTELPGAGTSSPIVVGSHIFLTCYRGFGVPGEEGDMSELLLQLVCLDRGTGKIQWTKEVVPKLPEQPTIREGHGYASSTPVADKERVYVFFGKSGVLAFDHAGKQLWQKEVGSELHGWGSAASPVLAGDLVIVNASVESESLVGLNRQTGREVWRTGGIKDSWNTPVLVNTGGGRQELVLAIFGKVLGVDPSTGKQRWSCDTDIGWYMVPSMAVHDGIIYCIGGRSGGGLAVRAGGQGDVTASHRLWTSRKGSNVNSPVYHDGHLYWMHEALGIAYCADAKTGELEYEERLQRADQVYAATLLADGKLYYLTRSGRTFVLAAKPQFEQLARNDFAGRSQFNASPAVAENRLLIRSDKYLYCIGQD